MVRSITLLATASFALTAAFALPALAQDVLPRPEQAFKGHIGRTVEESTKDFPQEVKAPKGASNILLILTDDVGFGASSTFGGPVPTPTMDRLANERLRYTGFHTTALCSPTRAALLTGHCPHKNGMVGLAHRGFRLNDYHQHLLHWLRPHGYRSTLIGVQHISACFHSTPDSHATIPRRGGRATPVNKTSLRPLPESVRDTRC